MGIFFYKTILRLGPITPQNFFLFGVGLTQNLIYIQQIGPPRTPFRGRGFLIILLFCCIPKKKRCTTPTLLCFSISARALYIKTSVLSPPPKKKENRIKLKKNLNVFYSGDQNFFKYFGFFYGGFLTFGESVGLFYAWSLIEDFF